MNVPIPENGGVVSEASEIVEVTDEDSGNVDTKEFAVMPVAGNVLVDVSIIVNVEEFASRSATVDVSIDVPTADGFEELSEEPDKSDDPIAFVFGEAKVTVDSFSDTRVTIVAKEFVEV